MTKFIQIFNQFIREKVRIQYIVICYYYCYCCYRCCLQPAGRRPWSGTPTTATFISSLVLARLINWQRYGGCGTNMLGATSAGHLPCFNYIFYVQ